MEPWKYHVVSGWNAPKIGDEIVLWARRIAKQSRSKQSAVGFLDGDSQRGRLASQLSYDRLFEISHEELGHLKANDSNDSISQSKEACLAKAIIPASEGVGASSTYDNMIQ
jgi:hypothetical protein